MASQSGLNSDLVEASMSGQTEKVRALLAAGADIHWNDDYALRGASLYGHVDTVKVLLAADADAHAENDGALCWASIHGHTETVKALLAAGADVHAQNDGALREASIGGHTEMVKVLLREGADVDARGGEALRQASRYGHDEIVKTLLAAGADARAPGVLSWAWASRNGDTETVKALRKAPWVVLTAPASDTKPPARRPRLSVIQNDKCREVLVLRKRSVRERLPLSAGWRNDQSMTDQAEQVSTTGSVDTKQQPGPTKRRHYSEALKRQIVAETQAPGASVSIVARRHDVNSNQLFRWRRQLLPKTVVESGAMLPVEIARDDGRPRRTDREGAIEIAFGCGARVRLRGEVSSETLRQVIELLR